MTNDFSIVSDSGPIVRHCANLSCQGAELVEWKGLLACNICGKIYDQDSSDDDKEGVTIAVRYATAVNRLEDETMIAPLVKARLKGRERKVTEYDDAFFQRRGIVVLEDQEDLPVSIEQERKQQAASSKRSSRRTTTGRQGDFGRTKAASEYSR